MKMHMDEIGITDQVEIFTDGIQTVVTIEETIDELFSKLEGFEGRATIWPIPLLIVDINMPFNGMEVTSFVKGLYRKLDKQLLER